MGGIILWMILGVFTGLLIGPITALSNVTVVLSLAAIAMFAIFVFVQREEPDSIN